MTTIIGMDPAKTSTSFQVEVDTSVLRGMPETLRHLDDDEMKKLNHKLVRKVDLIVLPIIAILYILNYVDRQNLAAAKIQGITDDLNMTTQQFATSISILFVGYLPFQIPSNLIITKISRPGLYICCAVVIWGAISAATAVVKSYGQLLAVRAILGASEAVFFPGAIYYLSAWYTKTELGKRIAILYITQQVGNAFGGPSQHLFFSLTGHTTLGAGSGSSSSKVLVLLELASSAPSSCQSSRTTVASSRRSSVTLPSGA